MTTTSTEQAAQSLNGAGPAPGEPEAAEGPAASERIMGAIGIAFAVGLALIGLDMITGGAVTRALTGGRDAESGG